MIAWLRYILIAGLVSLGIWAALVGATLLFIRWDSRRLEKEVEKRNVETD